MSNIVLQFTLFLWITGSVIAALYFCLKNDESANVYVQVFLWLISPVLVLKGLLILRPDRKKMYFRLIKTMLFLN